ncbi:TPA: transcriptional regulator [Citrobacter freundii]|nr:transcriptional regulator [Citrobacter freundii]
MAKGYLINEKIEFWPAENRLTSRDKPGVMSQLTTPATRCLVILLEKAPEIVSQDVFFEKVWEEAGMHVPPNTLYQNISLVRRGLKSVSNNNETDDIIVTIPRQGFRIRENVSVREIDEEVVITPVPEKAADTITLPVTLSIEAEENLTKEDALREANNVQRSGFIKNIILVLILIAVVAGAFFTGYLLTEDDPSPSFAGYTQLPEENGCKYFINPDSMTNETGNAVSKAMINCKVYPWVYITSYKHVPVMSVISCNTPLDGGETRVGCVSLFLRDIP